MPGRKEMSAKRDAAARENGTLFRTPTYKFVFNLRAVPFSEECKHTMESGEEKDGIFIPYDDAFVYRAKSGSYLNMFAMPSKTDEKGSLALGIHKVHRIFPYWTKEQTKIMEEKGFDIIHFVLGWTEFHKMVSFGKKQKKEDKK